MREWFSATELSSLPGMPSAKRAIAVKAKRKGWQYREVRGNGGRCIEFHIDELPAETKAHLLSIYKEQDNAQPDRADGLHLDDAAGDNSPSNAAVMLSANDLDHIGAPSQPEQQPEPAVAKPKREPRANGKPKSGKGEAKIDAWVEIFKARKTWCAAQGIAKQVNCDDAFSEAYLRHEIDLPEQVYETVTRISRSTIARKRSENEKGGVTALAGKEGAGRPK